MSVLSPAQRTAWEQALDLWGVRLREPQLQPDADQGTFAWFSFPPQVYVDPAEAERNGVGDQLVSIFAHEIGHHVLAPSTRATGLKIIQQMARAITVTVGEPPAALLDLSRRYANLWADLLINDRVARRQAQVDPTGEPEMILLWRRLAARTTAGRSWWVVLRAYERLWSLPAGTLCPAESPEVPGPALADHPPDPALDAALLAETVRTFAVDPVAGALRFGMIMAGYLELADGSESGCGGEAEPAPPTPAELAEVLRDPRLSEPPEHPAVAAARRSGLAPTTPLEEGRSEGDPAAGQGYGLADTLALWSAADPSAVTRAWYESSARRFVRPLQQPAPTGAVTEDLPGALEPWTLDDDLDRIDWPATMAAGPVVVPGVTTRQRSFVADDPPVRLTSVELDLYIDSSGSMPTPQTGSPAVLAGTIMIGSVLRVGGRVRVTSFSGPGAVAGTGDFTRRGAGAMAALLHYFGGGTTFPLDLLAERYLGRTLSAPGRPVRRRHLVVLSDDGLASMFGQGQPAYADVAARVAERLDTATLMVQDPHRQTATDAAEAGYTVAYLDTMADAPVACAALAATITGGRVRRG